MSIQSWFSNTFSKIGNDISPFINSAVQGLNTIIGDAKTTLSSLWDGGFVGIDEKNAPQVKDALETYISNMEDILATYNTKTDIGQALKGDAKDAAELFLEAIKELMSAYISTMRQSEHDLDDVLVNYSAGSKDIAQQVSTDAEDIRKQAQDIKMD